MDLPRAIICDIDGTIADYDEAGSGEPDLNYPIANILKVYGLQDKYDVALIFLTARCEKYRDKTVEWLKKHGLSRYEALLMKPNDDVRPDHVVKQAIYDKYIRKHYDVLFALEDRDTVVRMWRNLDITCLQVDYGDYV